MKTQAYLERNKIKKVRSMLKSGRLVEARKACEKICARTEANSQAWCLLGEIHYRLGGLDEAMSCFESAVRLDPENSDAFCQLADIYRQQGRLDKAADNYREALKKNNGDPKFLTNFAGVLMGLLRYSEAESLLKSAIEINPELSQPYTNLGSCLNAQGKTREALLCFEKGLQVDPQDAVMHSNYLLTSHYLPGPEPLEMLDAHREWARRHSGVAGDHKVFQSALFDRQRKLRIGYVSPDLRLHSVAYFLKPLLENHARDTTETFCYADVRQPDAMTLHLKNLSNGWRDTSRYSDQELEKCIRNDRIDILVDLAGHTAGNRLGVFARKPAPVQITWLGYPDTTGLDEMDYRISDNIADPDGYDSRYTEKLYRLPGCFVCYGSLPDAPDVATAPYRDNGKFTFGSFNNLSKINAGVVQLWADILKSIPGAQLIIKNPGLTDTPVQEKYLEMFTDAGVDRSRVQLKGVSRSISQHLSEYGTIDIALDTFPYNGATTTCEALWMGVPVLTLEGDTHAGRVCSSMLSAAGMEEWVASSPAEYVEKAVAMVADADSISIQRPGMRQKLRDSILCNGKDFTRDMETAYREMWQRRCANNG